MADFSAAVARARLYRELRGFSLLYPYASFTLTELSDADRRRLAAGSPRRLAATYQVDTTIHSKTSSGALGVATTLQAYDTTGATDLLDVPVIATAVPTISEAAPPARPPPGPPQEWDSAEFGWVGSPRARWTAVGFAGFAILLAAVLIFTKVRGGKLRCFNTVEFTCALVAFVAASVSLTGLSEDYDVVRSTYWMKMSSDVTSVWSESIELNTGRSTTTVTEFYVNLWGACAESVLGGHTCEAQNGWEKYFAAWQASDKKDIMYIFVLAGALPPQNHARQYRCAPT